MANYKLNNKTVDHLDPWNVGACIGYYGGDYYTVCTHENINPKSKCKPVPSFVQVKGSGENGEISDEERKENNYGNVIHVKSGIDCWNAALNYTNDIDKDTWSATYSPKYLGSDVVKYARILDFNGYDHNAGDWCTVTFLSEKAPIHQSKITLSLSNTFIDEINDMRELTFAKDKSFGLLIKRQDTAVAENALWYCNIDISDKNDYNSVSIDISTIDLVQDGKILGIIPVFTEYKFITNGPTLVSTLNTQATFKAFVLPYTKIKYLSVYNPGPQIMQNIKISIKDLNYTIEEPTISNGNMRKLTINSCEIIIANNNNSEISLSSVAVKYCIDYVGYRNIDNWKNWTSENMSYHIDANSSIRFLLDSSITLSHPRGDGEWLIGITYRYQYDGAWYGYDGVWNETNYNNDLFIINMYDYINN